MVLLHMLFEIPSLGEGFIANMSLVGFDSHMHSGVVNEIPSFVEDLVTTWVFSENGSLPPPWAFRWFYLDNMWVWFEDL